DHLESIITANRLTPNLTARALQDQACCRDVPQSNAALEISIESSRCHVGQIERASPHNPDFAHTPSQSVQQRQGGLQMFSAFGQTNGNDCLGKFPPATDTDPFAI